MNKEQYIMRHEVMTAKLERPDIIDYTARLLVLICALNLNGAFNMMFGVGQVVSLVILLTTLTLIVSRGRAAISTEFILLAAAIVSYLILGTLFYDPFHSSDLPQKYYRAYIGGIIIVWAVAGYVRSLSFSKLSAFLSFTRNIYLITALSVWLSPFLYTLYVHVPPSHFYRSAGFFGNPNGAAIASAIALALTLGLPFQNRFFQFAAATMATGAIILTFSKAGMSVAVVILTWHCLSKVKGVFLIFLPFVVALCFAFIQEAQFFLNVIIDNPVLELTEGQKNRLLFVGEILSGTINEETTTGRSYLWGLVMESISANFPLGSGIGSAHHIIGGIFESEAWQGVHNTFLMILMESGIVPFCLFVIAMLTLVLSLIRQRAGLFMLTGIFILVVDMMATHGAMGERYHNLLLGIIIGLAPRKNLKRSKNILMAR